MQRTGRTRKLVLTLEVTGDEESHTTFDGIHAHVVNAVSHMEKRSESGENCVVRARLEMTETTIHDDTGGPF